MVCNIMVKLKVCLFILCFYASLNSKNPCSIWCTLFMYIFLKKIPKKSSFPNLSKKKKKKKEKKKERRNRKNFKWESVWTRAIGPLNHLKKNVKIGPLNFLVNFSKRTNFFFLSRFKKRKRKKEVSFSKWYKRIHWAKHFLNLDA